MTLFNEVAFEPEEEDDELGGFKDVDDELVGFDILGADDSDLLGEPTEVGDKDDFYYNDDDST